MALEPSYLSIPIEQPWTATASVCIDQAQYSWLGMQIVIALGVAFLTGWFLGYYFKEFKQKK